MNKNDTLIIVIIAVTIIFSILIPFIIFNRIFNRKSKKSREIYCKYNEKCIRGNISNCNGDIFLSEKDCKLNDNKSKINLN